MKQSVYQSVQELRLKLSICFSGRIKVGFLRKYVFLQGSCSPVLAEDVREESDVCAIVAAKSA